jgi:hypothetical protein
MRRSWRDSQVPVNMSVFADAVTTAAWRRQAEWRAVIATEDNAFRSGDGSSTWLSVPALDITKRLHTPPLGGGGPRGSQRPSTCLQPGIVSDVISERLRRTRWISAS